MQLIAISRMIRTQHEQPWMTTHIHPLFFFTHYNPQKQIDWKIFLNRKIISRFINRIALLSFRLIACSLIFTLFYIRSTQKTFRELRFFIDAWTTRDSWAAHSDTENVFLFLSTTLQVNDCTNATLCISTTCPTPDTLYESHLELLQNNFVPHTRSSPKRRGPLIVGSVGP
jgi:hypothetical protein